MKPMSEIITSVTAIVDDPSTTPATIFSLVNSCLSQFAEKTSPSTLVEPFYQLEIYGGDSVVSLPDDAVSMRVISVFDVDRKKIKVFKRALDANALFQKAGKPSRNIEAVIVADRSLRLIPEASEDTSIYVTYVKKAPLYESLTDDGSAITFLPDEMANVMVENYAIATIYGFLEDGVTDSRNNYKFFYDLYMKARLELESLFVTHSLQAEPEFVQGADGIVTPTLNVFRAGGL